MAAKSIRQIKMYGKYQRRVHHYNGGRDLPWLNMSGVWLERAGFQIGDQLQITIQDNQLIITKTAAHGDQSH